MQSTLPTADEFFGPPPKPTADQFFGTAPSGPHTDSLLAVTAVGRILSAFGQGAENGWGTEPLGLSPDTEKALKENGLAASDVNDPLNFIRRGFHDSFIRPAAIGLDAALRVGSSALGAYQSGVEQIGKEVGAPILGRDIAALPESVFGSPGQFAGSFRLLRMPKVIEDAQSMKIIGPGGEAAFKGATPEGPPKPPAPNVESLTTPEAASAAIKELADKKAEITQKAGLRWTGKQGYQYFPERRSTLTDGELLDLADHLGLSPMDMNGDRIAKRFSPAEVDAAKDLVDASAKNLADKMEKVDPEDSASIEAFTKSEKIHRLLLDHISGLDAEEIKEKVTTEGKPVEVTGAAKEAQDSRAVEVAEVGKTIEDPPAINRFINYIKKLGPKAPDMSIELRNNGLISGFATHGDYGVGNYLLALTRAVPEAAAAGAFGSVRRAITGSTWGAREAEAAGQLYGFFAGHRQGLAAARLGWKTGQNTPLPGAPMTPLWTYPPAIPGRIGDLIRYPQKGVAAIHSFFRTVGYSQHLHGIAYREASEAGLTGNAFVQEVNRIVANPSLRQMEEATIEATKQTLMGEGGRWTNAMAQVVSDNKFLQFVIPFVRIQGNLARQTFLERTPLGFFDKEIRDNLLGKNGAEAQDKQAGAMLWSAAVAGGVATLMAQDSATGYGPTDPNKRREWLGTHQPYSINFFGHWVSYQHLGVVGKLTGLMADGYDLVHQMGKDSAEKWSGHLIAGLSHGLLAEGWLRDFSDMFNAFEDAVAGRGHVAQRYLNNFLVSFTPFSSFLNQTNQAFLDPNLREARTLLETFESKLPFLSQNLQPRRDVWGEPIERHSLLPGISAMWTRPVTADPVDTALSKVGYYPAPVPRTVRGVQLSPQQYDDLSLVSGRLMHTLLQRLVTQPKFDTLPVFAQVELVKGVSTAARSMAETQTLMTDPAFLKASVEKERARLKE